MTKESVHRVIIQPFNLKIREERNKDKIKKTKNRVRISNLDFDITV